MTDYLKEKFDKQFKAIQNSIAMLAENLNDEKVSDASKRIIIKSIIDSYENLIRAYEEKTTLEELRDNIEKGNIDMDLNLNGKQEKILKTLYDFADKADSYMYDDSNKKEEQLYKTLKEINKEKDYEDAKLRKEKVAEIIKNIPEVDSDTKYGKEEYENSYKEQEKEACNHLDKVLRRAGCLMLNEEFWKRVDEAISRQTGMPARSIESKMFESGITKDEIVSVINGHKIIQPVNKRMFLVCGLEELDIRSSDINWCTENTITRTLNIQVRDNLNCPLIKIQQFLDSQDNPNKSNNIVLDDIVIKTLDVTGLPLYETHYTGNLRITDLGSIVSDYSSSDPKTFDLCIKYTNRTVKDVREN